MKALKLWSYAIITDAAVGALLYFWLVDGVNGAKNIALMVIWTLAILRILSSFVLAKAGADKLIRPSGFTPYHVVTEIALICALAWAGQFGAATVVVISLVMFEAARGSALDKAKKKAAEPPTNLIQVFGDYKTTTFTLNRITEAFALAGNVLNVEGAFTLAGLRLTIQQQDPRAVVVNECGGRECDLTTLAKEFPGIHFYFAQ